jgi:undecaprenyl-diphosphatase
MNFIDTILQALIQGLTEFLPVSSSGHLVLFQQIFHVQQPHLFMDIILHIGTFAAVIVFFWKGLSSLVVSFVRKPFDLKNDETSVAWKIVVGSIPTALIGIIIKLKFESVFENLNIVLVFMLVTALFLFLSDTFRNRNKNVPMLSWAEVLLIGTAQGLAVLPGISRSGATITACLLVGMARKEAGVFSFYLGIPALIGAAVIELKDASVTLNNELILHSAVAFVISFLVALAGIRFLFFVLERAKFRYFSLYIVVVVAAAAVAKFVLKI